MSLSIDLITKKANQGKLELDTDALTLSFKTQFSNQVLCVNQEVGFDFNGVKLSVIIQSVEHANVGIAQKKSTNGATPRGQLLQITTLSYQKQSGSPSNIVFTGTSAVAMRNDSLFRSDFDFGKMGIGGLNEQFQTMFRRAFGSRLFPGLVKQLGINHIRGILLYGPPGCGKTLIARQIGKVLNAREPKIVNGPEILDKYVGGSQEKIRALFVDAEKEQAEMGGMYVSFHINSYFVLVLVLVLSLIMIITVCISPFNFNFSST
jgi:vesicle-fusing ATPase